MGKNNNPEIVIANNKKGGKMYVFPSDIYELVNNRMTLTIHEYIRGNPNNPGTLSEALATIVLPLPEGLRDEINLRFTEDAADFVGGTMSNFADGVPVSTMIGGGLGRFASKVVTAAGAVGDAVGLPASDAARAGHRAMGYAQNPNLALTFEGVSLREHNFSWELVAKSKEESKTLKDMLNTLKKATLPRKYSGANYAFAYPYIFKMSFQPENLLKISKLGCVCESMLINPMAGGTYAFFEGTGDPAVINLSMRFRERAVMTAEDFGAESVSLMKGSTGKL